ncbi:MAG: ABC transporter permease [Sarcina sp.]
MEVKSLIIASILMIIPIMISIKENLKIEKDIIISIIRAIVQIVIVGYILKYIFEVDNQLMTIIIVVIMIINAAINTRKSGGKIKNVMMISLLGLVVGTSITLVVLIMSKAIRFTPDEVIPISGMIITQAMIAIGLAYRNLNSLFKDRRDEIEVKLSLGANIKEASRGILRNSIRTAMSPNIDSAKTLGIVSLPGMMTGLILGGASPIVAIKFQIMVTFMMMSASSIAVIIVVYSAYKTFYNKREQLSYK